MRDARPSLFICAVLCAVLRSGFRDTVWGPFILHFTDALIIITVLLFHRKHDDRTGEWPV